MALLRTAGGKPAMPFSPPPACRRANGAAYAPPMRSSDCTKSSSDGSRPKPFCHPPTPPRCCSGRCLHPGRSTCARSTVGRRSPQNPSISQLTLPPETIPSCDRRMRHSKFQPLSGRHRTAWRNVLRLVCASRFTSADQIDKFVERHELRNSNKAGKKNCKTLTIQLIKSRGCHCCAKLCLGSDLQLCCRRLVPLHTYLHPHYCIFRGSSENASHADTSGCGPSLLDRSAMVSDWHFFELADSCELVVRSSCGFGVRFI